jgi:hypothetical protein
MVCHVHLFIVISGPRQGDATLQITLSTIVWYATFPHLLSLLGQSRVTEHCKKQCSPLYGIPRSLVSCHLWAKARCHTANSSVHHCMVYHVPLFLVISGPRQGDATLQIIVSTTVWYATFTCYSFKWAKTGRRNTANNRDHHCMLCHAHFFLVICGRRQGDATQQIIVSTILWYATSICFLLFVGEDWVPQH